MTLPVQEFQIGQRVRPHGKQPFIISYIRLLDGRNEYSMHRGPWHFASALTLASERPPYVPSERRVVQRYDAHMPSYAVLNNLYRCETDAELAARHAIERAEYEQQDATDPVIYNATGQPIGITGRTGQPGQPGRPGPGAA